MVERTEIADSAVGLLNDMLCIMMLMHDAILENECDVELRELQDQRTYPADLAFVEAERYNN